MAGGVNDILQGSCDVLTEINFSDGPTLDC